MTGIHEAVAKARPAPKTVTRRKDLAQRARKNLATYRNVAEPAETSSTAVLRLLWAIADAEVALSLETGGKVGSPHATAGSVARRLGLIGS